MTTATAQRGHLLVVDDDAINRMILARAMEGQGHLVTAAEDGQQALDLLQVKHPVPYDVVLLDIVMPVLDGYQTLERIKRDSAVRHIPVIMISAVDEMESVVRCIEMGATDYIPRPLNATLLQVLQARITTSLAAKRLRDLELEYLERVGHVAAAAAAVEAGAFEPRTLDGVAARPDALGQLARVFQRMAREVRAREERLQQQVRELRIEIDEVRQARKVAEITESEYFRDLRRQADDLRKIVERAAERPVNRRTA